jgi:hypothetical protein
MENNLLYFPYISIEKSPWLYKTLLYFDNISTITPIEYMENPELFDDHMQPLIREQLIKTVFPAQYIREISLFENNFIQLIKRKYGFFSRNPKRLTNINKHSTIHQNYTKINFEKIGGKIIDFLTEHNLAFKESFNWYNIREDISRDYMNYLAIAISNSDNYSPVTDSTDNISPFYSNFRTPVRDRSRLNRDLIHKNNIRTNILDQLFCVPAYIDKIETLLDFKEKNCHSLTKFRKLIEETVSTINAVSMDKQEDRIKDFLNHIEEEKTILKEEMSKFWRITDFGSLIWYVPTSYELAHVLGDDNTLTAQTISLSTAVTKGIYDTYRTVSNRNMEINNNPLSYVIKAESKFNMDRKRNASITSK